MSGKNYCRILNAFNRAGGGFIDFVMGSRGNETNLVLFANMFFITP